MADDWEDWENDDFTPQLPAAPAVNPVAAPDDVEVSKFAGEDEEEDQPQYNVPKPQQVRSQKLLLGEYKGPATVADSPSLAAVET